MEPAIFLHVSIALALGLTAQVLGQAVALPSILFLLAFGVVAGPDGLMLLDPSLLGSAVGPLVTLGVTVILFEGGVALRWDEIRAQQRSLSLLMTVGGAISMGVGTVAARTFLDLPWALASLYGALMIVTGPTVVTPMLSRIPLDRRVRELLVGEGVLIDPLGAIIAIVVAEYIVGQAAAWEAAGRVIIRLGVGAAIGVASSWALARALRHGWIADELRNPVVLGTALITAAVASAVSSEAGLMAAVVQGVVLGNIGLRSIATLRQFKEELTVLLLSFLFVVLAADLRLSAVAQLGWASLAVVAMVAWIARPLAVFASTSGSLFAWQEKVFISWICPRGIVAVSVAGFFARELEHAGIEGGDKLEALVFVTVAATVVVQGLSARWVARRLGVDRPLQQETLIVGANSFGRLVAGLLQGIGRPVAIIDTNASLCQQARTMGIRVIQGDARAPETLEHAGARYAYALIALTQNAELNIVVCDRARANFRIERVLAVADTIEHAPFPGGFRGVEPVCDMLAQRRGRLRAYRLRDDARLGVSRRLGDLPWQTDEFSLLLLHHGALYLASGDQLLHGGDILVVFHAGRDSQLDTNLECIVESSPDEPREFAAQLRIGRTS